MQILVAGAATSVLETVPTGKLSFPAFAAMYIVATLCLRTQADGVQRIYHLRDKPPGREGCTDLVAEHFEHVYESLISGASPPGADSALTAGARSKFGDAMRRHIFSLLPEGPLGVADAEPRAVQHYAHLPADKVWSRFVVRAPRHQRLQDGSGDARAWLQAQEAWGWQGAWAAVRLAGRLDELSARSGNAGDWLDAWLTALGTERQSMLDGRESVEGEQRQVGYRRWRGTQQTLTPISGHYRPMWREALLRRASEHGSPGLFQLPDSEAGDLRAWRCGAVLSWADVEPGCYSITDERSNAAPLSAARDAAPPASGPSLLPIPGGGCRVLLSRAILRSPADAAALGIADCGAWFGAPVVQHNASYAVRPQWIHADLVAVQALERHILPTAFRRVASAVHAVRESSSAESVAQRLLVAAEAIASFTFYLFNGALYTRGSAAIAILSHHAMYLWMIRLADGTDRGQVARHRLQALRCLPLWRSHSMPDIEASSVHTAEEYVRGAYWTSFDRPVEEARQWVIGCLEKALRPDQHAAKRGRQDARRLDEVLRSLPAVPDAHERHHT